MQDVTNAELDAMMPNDGDTTKLADKRDGEKYLVGKLADGNVWLLDNLALDPTTVSLATLQGNTNASDATLNYFKNGGGTTSDQYVTAGVSSNWSTNSFSAPLINADYKNTVPPYAPSDGLGSNKVGVYYNYCAVFSWLLLLWRWL